MVRYLTILYILGDYIMKNTVKLEQFKEVTELELQEIRGGEIRLPYIFKKLFFNWLLNFSLILFPYLD